MPTTKAQLDASPVLRYSHSALRRGYESRRTEGHAEPYKGRYGEGVVWISPRWDTTQYVTVSYYIKTA